MFLKEWKKITKDPFILNSVKGCSINFVETPSQISLPYQVSFNKTELEALKIMIDEAISEEIIKDLF